MVKYLDYDGLLEFKNQLDNSLDDKVDKIIGKGLSTNDFTTDLKNKLDNIEAGATANEGTVTGITIGQTDYIPINGLITLPDYPTIFGASGTNHSSGLVPDPGASEGNTKFLREDGTWQTPPGGTTYESKSASSGGTDVSLVTIGEKYIWNNKQDTISDLSTIRSGASAGATAYLKPQEGIPASDIASGVIPTSLPASDVSSWAKANSKPSYNLDEVTDGASRKIPTKVSELTNDSGYLTSHLSLSGYATESWVGQQGYLTSHQSLSGYATESWVSSKFNDVLGINASGVSDLVSILSDNDTATGILNVIASKANASSIPTKVSDLTNDTGFITSYTNTVTSINGKTGEIAAADMATVLTAAGYALTDTNTWPTALSQLSNDVGYITGITSSMVTTALGYTPATTDTNTWRPITNTYTGSDESTSLSQYGANALYNALVNGYASSAGNADTVDNKHAADFMMDAGEYITGSIYDVPANRFFSGHTSHLRDVPDTSQTWIEGISVASNHNSNHYQRYLVGSGNRWYTTNDYSSGKMINWQTLAYLSDIPSSLPANGGNSSTVNGHSVNSDVPSNAVFTDTNTWRPLGTGANDACAGNDSRLSDSRPASDVYSWAKASTKPSYSYSEISGTPSSLPASDVYAWAKAANKPSYAYSEIGYTANAVTSAGGTLSLDGTVPLHVVTLTGNVSALVLSANPAAGHSCHVIFTATAARTVSIAHDATNRVCPKAKAVTLNITANGYVEVDFLNANNKIYVRGI